MSNKFLIQQLPDEGTIIWELKKSYQNPEEEIWRSTKVLGFPGYEVSNRGQVKTLKTGLIRDGSVEANGYLKIVLYNNGKSKDFRIHRLVAMLFIENPENKPTVDHIDRNPVNNHVSNLKWATQREQNANQKKHKKTKREVCCYIEDYEIIKKFEDLDGASKYVRMNPANLRRAFYDKVVILGYYWHFTDVVENEKNKPTWVKYKRPGYHTIEVSDTGLVRKLNKSHKGAIHRYGRMGPGSLRSNGYYRVGLNPLKNSGNEPFQINVHQLVALVFIGPEEGKIVNHIDGNKRNNHLDNLEYVTHQQNSQHAIDTGLSKVSLKNHFQPVDMFDSEGNFIKRYESIQEAADDNNCHRERVASMTRGITKRCLQLPGIVFRRAERNINEK